MAREGPCSIPGCPCLFQDVTPRSLGCISSLQLVRTMAGVRTVTGGWRPGLFSSYIMVSHWPQKAGWKPGLSAQGRCLYQRVLGWGPSSKGDCWSHWRVVRPAGLSGVLEALFPPWSTVPHQAWPLANLHEAVALLC